MEADTFILEWPQNEACLVWTIPAACAAATASQA